MTAHADNSLLERAQKVLPGGTFGNTGADLIIREGKAGRVWDENGNEFIDYLLGSGPMIVGHGHPEVNAATQEQLARGTRLHAITRHFVGAFHAVPGARAFRRHLAEQGVKPGAGLDVLRDAIARVGARAPAEAA